MKKCSRREFLAATGAFAGGLALSSLGVPLGPVKAYAQELSKADSHWRFKRIACPVCGNEDQDQAGYLYAEGRERERVELCRRCGKYLVALDVRGIDQEPVWQVAGLGLVHLDLLAQQEGLVPAARCAWNQLG
jgi:FdhE protein